MLSLVMSSLFFKRLKPIRLPFKSRGLIMKEEDDDEKEDLLQSPATNSKNSAQMFAEQKKFNARQGHGYAAERANHIHDIRDGKNAKIVGGDNKKNGPDRNVNGRNIQTKFCKSSTDTVRSMLNPDGSLRYMDGSKPMAVEVPKEQYNDVVSKLEQKIANGEIKNIKDPKVAKRIIRKSSITYMQSKNIAKFATVDGLVYDFEQATVEITNAKCEIGIGALVVFAHSMWNGDDFGDALKNSCSAAAKSGIVIGVRSVVLSELSKTPLDSTIKKFIGSKIPIGKSSAVRAEFTSSVVTLAILSVPDFIQFFSGQMPFSQLCKNVTITASGIAGGTVGASAGAAIAGAALGSFLPGVGTILGGFAGGIIGSLFGSSAASSILEDSYTTEDNRAEKILHETLGILSQDFMLTQDDAELMMIEFKRVDRSNYLLEIDSIDDNQIRANVCKTFVPIMQAILASHEHLRLPSTKEYNNYLKNGKVKKNPSYESYGFMKSEIQNSENIIKAKEESLRNKEKQFHKTKPNEEKINFWLNKAFIIFASVGLVYWFFSGNDISKLFLIPFYLLALAQVLSALDLPTLPERTEDWTLLDNVCFYSTFAKIISACLIVCWVPIGLACWFFDAISSELCWIIPMYISMGIVAAFLLKPLVYIIHWIKMKKIKIEIAKANKNIEKYKGKIDNLLSKIHANTTKFEAQYEPYELADAQNFYADYYAEHDEEHDEDVVQNKCNSQYNG